MKRIEFFRTALLIAVVGSALTLGGCAAKRPPSGLGQAIEVPCSDEEFRSTRTHFRGTGQGSSQDLSTARRKANLDANAMLAAGINRTIRSVTDRYTQDITVGDAAEFAEKFEMLTRDVVNQELNNVSIVCNKTFQKDGRYSVFVAVEVAKDELLNNMSNAISRDERLRLDYDKMKFEEIFNQEMEALANERP